MTGGDRPRTRRAGTCGGRPGAAFLTRDAKAGLPAGGKKPGPAVAGRRSRRRRPSVTPARSRSVWVRRKPSRMEHDMAAVVGGFGIHSSGGLTIATASTSACQLSARRAIRSASLADTPVASCRLRRSGDAAARMPTPTHGEILGQAIAACCADPVRPSAGGKRGFTAYGADDSERHRPQPRSFAVRWGFWRDAPGAPQEAGASGLRLTGRAPLCNAWGSRVWRKLQQLAAKFGKAHNGADQAPCPRGYGDDIDGGGSAHRWMSTPRFEADARKLEGTIAAQEKSRERIARRRRENRDQQAKTAVELSSRSPCRPSIFS